MEHAETLTADQVAGMDEMAALSSTIEDALRPRPACIPTEPAEATDRQAAPASIRTISAHYVQLALVARRHNMGTGGTRWAAMSNGASDQGCRPARCVRHWHIPKPSLMSPMDRGRITRVVDRVRSQGRREVLATFGVGIRAVLASVPSSILKVGQ